MASDFKKGCCWLCFLCSLSIKTDYCQILLKTPHNFACLVGEVQIRKKSVRNIIYLVIIMYSINKWIFHLFMLNNFHKENKNE